MLNKKIMVVDDDEIHQFTTKLTLQRTIGCDHIDGRTSPVQALAYLQKNQDDKELMPDLILLDINMPIMDGFEFLEFMESSVTKNIPIVFMVSSSNYKSDVDKAFRHKVVREYMSKPIDPHALKAKMDQHLG